MTVLVLAGSAEARDLCARLAGRVPVLASLAGAVRRPLPLGVPTRVGGFGGEAGFLAVLAAEGIGAVVDATHPFAARITARTAGVCLRDGVPLLRLERPGWLPEAGDRWTWVADEAAAARRVVAGGEARVFLATGRQTLGAFAVLARGTVWCRVIDPPQEAFPFPHGGWVVGRPPFTVEDEVDLFRRLGVEVLVVKDSGADEARAKLVAARRLGLPVIILRRPPATGAVAAVPVVATVDAAVDWVMRL